MLEKVVSLISHVCYSMEHNIRQECDPAPMVTLCRRVIVSPIAGPVCEISRFLKAIYPEDAVREKPVRKGAPKKRKVHWSTWASPAVLLFLAQALCRLLGVNAKANMMLT